MRTKILLGLKTRCSVWKNDSCPSTNKTYAHSHKPRCMLEHIPFLWEQRINVLSYLFREARPDSALLTLARLFERPVWKLFFYASQVWWLSKLSPPLPRCFQSRSSLHHFFSKKCFYQYFTLVVSQYRYVDGEMVESSLNVLQYGSFLLGEGASLRPFQKTAVFLKKKVSRDEKSHLIHYFHCFATSVILFA